MREAYETIKRINSLDPASIAERLCKLFEESGELAQAVNKTIGRKVTNQEEDIRDLVIEEAADTIQCVISLIDSYDISYDELIDKLNQKNIKWEKVVKNRK